MLKQMYLKQIKKTFSKQLYDYWENLYPPFYFQFDQVENNAIGSLRYVRNHNNTTIRPVNLCVHKYRSGDINDTKHTYNIDSNIDIGQSLNHLF